MLQNWVLVSIFNRWFSPISKFVTSNLISKKKKKSTISGKEEQFLIIQFLQCGIQNENDSDYDIIYIVLFNF